ncbi:hypothetical protein ACFV30_31210 [Streptomyces sp. NPDC059752]|uniref:hypothetical protein n=1 Tax=unclassified Streptomyces TaxID=2593676 RepID=UPI0036622AC6
MPHAASRISCLRIDSLLSARVEDLGYGKGHRVLLLEKVKGGGRKKKPIPLVTWDALIEYLDGRTTGWLFCTTSGGRLDEPAVWRLLQSLAKRAGLPLRGLHGVKGDAVTHALAKPDARPVRFPAHPVVRPVKIIALGVRAEHSQLGRPAPLPGVGPLDTAPSAHDSSYEVVPHPVAAAEASPAVARLALTDRTVLDLHAGLPMGLVEGAVGIGHTNLEFATGLWTASVASVL